MKWDQIIMYDLTIGTGEQTPVFPTFQPLRIENSNIDGNANQIINTSNHVGTHLHGNMFFDEEIIPGVHYYSLDKLCHPGVVVDLSDEFGDEDYGIYTFKDIEKRVEVKDGDILIINTGYHKYGWELENSNEEKYMLRHPGPDLDFIDWCRNKHLRWIGVDCPSIDHPQNTIIRELYKNETEKCDSYMKEKYRKSLDEIFPWPEQCQAMHKQLLPRRYGEILHVECIGGQIDLIPNKRIVVGCFPWKGVGIESAFCRVVAFDGFTNV